MAISSSVLKPRRRLANTHRVMEQASSSAQRNRPAMAGNGICDHRPATTAPLKAEYTTSRMEPWSTTLMDVPIRTGRWGPPAGRIRWPTMNGTNSCSAILPMAASGSADEALTCNMPTSSRVNRMPSKVEPDALQMAAGMLPRASAVSAMAAARWPAQCTGTECPGTGRV